MPLLFLPDGEVFFHWGQDHAPRIPAPWLERGQPRAAELVTAQGLQRVDGLALPLIETTAALAVVPNAELEALPASIASWVLASKLAIDLVARERVVPTITRVGGRIEARWAAALSLSEDAARVAALARSMPP